jgi:hypothetical protein
MIVQGSRGLSKRSHAVGGGGPSAAIERQQPRAGGHGRAARAGEGREADRWAWMAQCGAAASDSI